MSWSIPPENSKPSTLPRTIIRRWWDMILSIDFSPIERWLDGNYAPQSLNLALEENPDSYVIIAPLYGFDRQDVHVDLCRGHVIILLAHDDDAASDGREYYGEFAIPADARSNRALVNVVDNFLTVTLYRKVNLIKRAAAALIHLGRKVELPLSKE